MVCLEHASSIAECLGEPLPLSDVFSALQECRKSRDLRHGKRFYLLLCHHGLEAHASVGNHLVPTLLECGGFEHAKAAFNKLLYRNEHTWTALMQSYLDRGEPELALSLYGKMQDDCVCPTEYTFVPLLRSCGWLKWDTVGKELHSEIICGGFENDLVLGNTLVDMYSKCWMLPEAHQAFHHLPYKDVVSWNILIAAYAEQGIIEEAHALYKQMLVEGLHPDPWTFNCVLNACSKTRVVSVGQEIHAEIIQEGHEEDAVVVSNLVDFYAHCGLLEDSQDVFDQLQAKDVIVWTALIAGYAEYGPLDKALSCYELMQHQGVNPDSVTFVCILKTIESTGDVEKGREIHAQIVKQEGCYDPFLGNSLVCMYARHGSLADAELEFERLRERTVVSWTALIAGYAEFGLSMEAFKCVERMKLEGVSPNAVTCTCVMQVHCNRGTISEGLMFHIEIVKKAYEMDPSVCNMVLKLYIKFGFLLEARAVFDACRERDINSWNLLIAGYAGHGLTEEVSVSLKHMQSEGWSPSAAIYSSCLKHCANARLVNMGFNFHVEVLKKGFEREPSVGSALLELYAKCTSLVEVEGLLHKLSERDVCTWNVLIRAYVECGHFEEALRCVKSMYTENVLPNTASWNVIILGFVEVGQSIKSLELYLEMQAQGVLPDNVMLVSVLKACSELATLELGKRIHAAVNFQGDHSENIELYNTVVDMYGKCGSMKLAQEVFDSMASKDLVTWNTLLAGHARQGASDLVFHFHSKMREENVQPDDITFLSIFAACSHAGSLYRSQVCLNIMTKEYGLFPTLKHYTCIVDHCGRAGHLEEAMAIVERLPVSLDLTFWDMVLGCFHNLEDIKVGTEAFDSLLRLDENHPMAFILLSNMHANVYTCV